MQRGSQSLTSQEAAHKAADDAYQRVFDSLSANIAVVDATGVILMTNKPWREFAGLLEHDAEHVSIGANYLQHLQAVAFDSPHAARIVEAAREVLAGTRDQAVQEYPLPTPDGERWFYCRMTRFSGPGPLRMVVAHSDISALKRAQQAAEFSRQKFSSLFDFAPDAMLLYDDEGCIVEANLQTQRMFGWPQTELIGQPVTLLMPSFQSPSSAQEACAASRFSPDAGGVRSAPPTGRCANGATFPIDAKFGSIASEFGHVHVASIRDVTDRERTYLELERSHENLIRANTAVEKSRQSLERRVATRTAELSVANEQLQRAKEEAESAAKAKSDFLAWMSHEIRTPMNGVIGMVEVLARSSLSEQQADAVATIETSAGALLCIVDDILDFSKVEAGHLELHITAQSVAEICESVCATLNPSAAAGDVDLTVYVAPDVPGKASVDDTRLRQILFNLLGNAIKFSRGREGRRGLVQLRCSVAATQPLQLAFEISDNGIGIEPAVLTRLFQPFVQGEATITRRFGGTGLGLAISRRLATLMHGDISVQSTPGRGSTFKLLLPLPPVLAQGSAGHSVPRELADLHCIWIRGTVLQPADLRDYLVGAGATFDVVDDWNLAVEVAGQSLQPSVILEEWAAGDPLQREPVCTGAPHLPIRHVLITFNRDYSRQNLPGVTVAEGLLRRRSWVRAVATAAGRVTALPEPHERAGSATAELPSISEARARGQLILVAEDDAVNQKVILSQLALLGRVAEIAPNGVEALRLWRSGRYALLLTDLHMPEMDGYALAQAIRREASGDRHFPILALTADVILDKDSRLRGAGIDQCLTKPLRPAVLEAALRRWLPLADAMAASAEATPGQAGPREIPPLNLGTLRDLIGHDPAVLAEVVGDFRKGLREARSEMQDAVRKGRLNQMGAIAHRLKSSSRAVGAMPLGDLCAEIENCSKTGNLTEMQLHLGRFERAALLLEASLVRRVGVVP